MALSPETTDSSDLRQAILNHCAAIRHDGTKDSMRAAHHSAVLRGKSADIPRLIAQYGHVLASGSDICPDRIDPVLIPVSEPHHNAIFRLARHYWSLPFSKGYGRRLRFLVMDRHNDKLIGILGLQSPPIAWALRDRLLTFPDKVTKERGINQTLDAFTVGALPPYSYLIGGKLIALAMTANEVREAYRSRYGDRVTCMEKRRLGGDLVAITTTSAFGKSSIYNRLTFQKEKVCLSLGFTEGYGNFHLTTLVPEIRRWLATQGIVTRSGFGSGPRAIWSDITRACTLLGLDNEKILGHGMAREGFVFPLAVNWQSVITEIQAPAPHYYDRPFSDLAAWWKTRWALTRAASRPEWKEWTSEQTIQAIREPTHG